MFLVNDRLGASSTTSDPILARSLLGRRGMGVGLVKKRQQEEATACNFHGGSMLFWDIFERSDMFYVRVVEAWTLDLNVTRISAGR